MYSCANILLPLLHQALLSTALGIPPLDAQVCRACIRLGSMTGVCEDRGPLLVWPHLVL